MGKTTKRERKYQASGGIKHRLEKGFVAKKNKLRRRKRKESSQPVAAVGVGTRKSDRKDSFLGEANLGDVDVTTFLSRVATELESPNEIDPQDDNTDRFTERGNESPGITYCQGEKREEQEDECSTETNGIDEHKITKESDSNESSEIKLFDNKVLVSLVGETFGKHRLKGLRDLVRAYRSACRSIGIDDSGEANINARDASCCIESPVLADKVFQVCIGRSHEEFLHHLETDNLLTKDSQHINPRSLQRGEKWEDMKPILHSFFLSTILLLENTKSAELLAFALKAMRPYMVLLSPFPQLAEKLLKSFVSIWSSPGKHIGATGQGIQLNAFLRIRQLALAQPYPFIESALKKAYLAYARRAKFGDVSATSGPDLPALAFMGNCLCDLYCLDHHSSYQHAFVYIRQLALLLRAFTRRKSQDAGSQVYCWQYIHCLKLWVSILTDTIRRENDSNESNGLMSSLVYPLTEIIYGVIQYCPAPVRHLPLRFHCVRLLQQLAASARVFIPTTTILLDILDFKEWYLSTKKSEKAASTKPLHLTLRLSSKGEALRLKEHREECLSTFILLINREIDLYRYSPGFPEFALRVTQRLRAFSKARTLDNRWKAQMKVCIEICERYSVLAVKLRSKAKCYPNSLSVLEFLKPPEEPAMGERLNASMAIETDLLRLRFTDSHVSKGGGDSSKSLSVDILPGDKTKGQDEKMTDERVDLAAEDQIEENVDWSDDE